MSPASHPVAVYSTYLELEKLKLHRGITLVQRKTPASAGYRFRRCATLSRNRPLKLRAQINQRRGGAILDGGRDFRDRRLRLMKVSLRQGSNAALIEWTCPRGGGPLDQSSTSSEPSKASPCKQTSREPTSSK